MTAAPHRKSPARELFDAVLEHAPDLRAAFVARACAGDASLRRELEALLTLHEEALDLLRDPTARPSDDPGDRIDRYELVQKIGEGGFGTVWTAEQKEPVCRRVALKVLKAGMDTVQVIRRFEAERQTLALMDHPHIAKVFDGGVTPNGRPYFVMELVDGVPITRFCDEGGLSMNERLELFVPVCQAVQHAHQKGIIHRDLKPSNVLVRMHDGRPAPKVIDFGIAKATRGALTERTVFTDPWQMIGTPEYMAPEQAERSGIDVDTRADVYSLGVLLYELLTGTQPFKLTTLLQSGYAEMLRTIQEVDPPKPSTRVSTLGEQLFDVAKFRRVHPRSLGSLMRGDLDWIVMKALEKERDRRYATAAALADDVLRHLRDEPVSAGPPSRLYRVRKYVQRHRVGVAAGSAIALALMIGAGAAVGGYTEASRQATKSGHLVELLQSMLSSSDPHRQKGQDYTVRQLLDDFDQDTMRQLDESEVRLALLQTVGRSYLALSLPEKAAAHIQAARDLAAKLLSKESEPFAACEALHAEYLQACGRHDEAAAVYAALLSRSGASLQVARTDDWRRSLADCARIRGRFDDAIGTLRDLITDVQRRDGDQRLAVAITRQYLSVALLDRNDPGDCVEAERLTRSVLDTQRELLPPDDFRITASLNNLAAVLRDLDQLVAAGKAYEEVLERDLDYYGPDHAQVAEAKVNLAEVWRMLGQPTRAEHLLREAVATFGGLGTNPLNFAWALNQLGSALFSQARREAAAEVWREALAIRQSELGDHDSVARVMQNLALALSDDKPDEARGLLEEALAMRIKLHGPDHREVAVAQTGLGSVLMRQGELERAEELLRLALATRRKAAPAGGSQLAQSTWCLGECLVKGGRLGAGVELLEQALDLGRACLPAGHPELAPTLLSLAQARWQLGDLEASAAACREAVKIRCAVFGPEHAMTVAPMVFLVQILLEHGPADAACQHANEVIAAIRGTTQAGDPRLAGPLILRARADRMAGLSESAESALREALTLCEGASPRDLGLAGEQSACGAFLLAQDRAAEAEPLLRECVELYAALDPKSNRRWMVASLLGGALARQGRFADAEPLLVTAAEHIPANLPMPDGKCRPETWTRLVDLYTRWGKPLEAERWRRVLADHTADAK